MAVRDAGVPPARVRPSGYFFFRLDLSVTVVRGFRFAVDLELNRPLMALLARVMRLPPVFFFAAIVPPPLGPPLAGHGSSVPTPVHRMRAPECVIRSSC
jgi:hypothetical protein